MDGPAQSQPIPPTLAQLEAAAICNQSTFQTLHTYSTYCYCCRCDPPSSFYCAFFIYRGSMAFESGTAYSESDADDEYERSVHDSSPVLATDSEASPTDSDGLSSSEHTPTTYGARSSGDRLPETIITEWTADECADFVSSLGLRQYGDRFLGMLPSWIEFNGLELTW
jgi:hypothetical protein